MSDIKIKYIDGKKENGIQYDWKFLRKEFQKLGTPKDIATPFTIPKFYENGWNIMLSERSIGKTTNWLLLGLIMNWHYGTQTIYLRDTDNEIKPSNLKKLFDVVIQFDYIKKITDGRWNSCFYYGKNWKFCNIDEEGKITEKASEAFCICVDILHAEILTKSSFNAPKGDLIIYDEFIKQHIYNPNQFVDLMDFHKTVARFRKSVVTVMLANTINPDADIFHEFDIYDTLTEMEINDIVRISTKEGTNIGIALIGARHEIRKLNSATNRLYYGFKNPKLNSIKGGEWAYVEYPHMTRDILYEVLDNSIRINTMSNTLKVNVCRSDAIGVFLFVTYASGKVFDDTIFFDANTDVTDYRTFSNFSNPVGSLINRLVNDNKVLFANNRVGRLFYNELKKL